MLHYLTKIRIHPLLPLIMIFLALYKKLDIFLIFYLCAILHEFFHFLACYILDEKAEKFELLPYGVCMKVKFIKNPISSLIIAISGPISNMILYLLTKDFYPLFASANFMIFFINLLPILPLDGGTVLKSLYTFNIGYIKSHKKLIKLTKFLSVLIVFLGIVLIIITKYNISLLIIGMFLLYNIKNEENNLITLRKRLLCNEFFIKDDVFKIKTIGAFYDTTIIKCIDYFTYNKLLIINVFSKDNKILGQLTQNDIIDDFLLNGIYSKLGDLMQKKGTYDEF